MCTAYFWSIKYQECNQTAQFIAAFHFQTFAWQICPNHVAQSFRQGSP